MIAELPARKQPRIVVLVNLGLVWGLAGKQSRVWGHPEQQCGFTRGPTWETIW